MVCYFFSTKPVGLGAGGSADELEKVQTTYSQLMGRHDVWYTPPLVTFIEPALNSGSQRTPRDLNHWIDQQTDVFTRYIVTYLERRKEQ